MSCVWMVSNELTRNSQDSPRTSGNLSSAPVEGISRKGAGEVNTLTHPVLNVHINSSFALELAEQGSLPRFRIAELLLFAC